MARSVRHCPRSQRRSLRARGRALDCPGHGVRSPERVRIVGTDADHGLDYAAALDRHPFDTATPGAVVRVEAGAGRVRLGHVQREIVRRDRGNLTVTVAVTVSTAAPRSVQRPRRRARRRLAPAEVSRVLPNSALLRSERRGERHADGRHRRRRKSHERRARWDDAPSGARRVPRDRRGSRDVLGADPRRDGALAPGPLQEMTR